jgi:peptidoglycan/LPS O-acetylase OafA/YrhL
MHAPQISVSSSANEYRADVDGLRAIAVLAVLLFHLGFSRFAGGFVGVDVFFVISGYLITGMIKGDVERGQFSMWRFLQRRARRLLPAMFAVIAASCVAAFLMLSPDHLRAFAKSAAAATLNFSNILFWREVDYFDLSARMKPLLHTWTLGVEWQFYLIWPVFVAFAMSGRLRWTAPQVIAAAAGASLLVAAVAGIFWPAATFYLMPFRIFEFAIGALLLWMPPVRANWAWPALPAGLVLIVAAVLLLDGKVFHNPAMMLLPTIGAALCIAGGTGSAGPILSNPVAAYIGRASYSIYLVHWPLIVFTEYFNFRPITTSEALKLFAISLIAGALLHHALEKPIHTRKAFNVPSTVGATLIALTALVILLPALLTIPNGLSWRVDADALGLRQFNSTTLVSKEILGPLGCTEPCVFGKVDDPKVLVFGDSHVDHFTKMLLNLGGTRYRFHYAGSVSCFNGATMTADRNPYPAMVASCQKSRETLLGWLKTYKYKAVIIGQRWFNYGQLLSQNGRPIDIKDQAQLEQAMLSDATALLPDFKGPVIITGWAPITNTACYSRPQYLTMTCPTINFDEYHTFRKSVTAFKAVSPLDIRFVDVAQAICPQGKCAISDREGRLLYTDSDHLSIYGAQMIVPQFLSIIDGATKSR